MQEANDALLAIHVPGCKVVPLERNVLVSKRIPKQSLTSNLKYELRNEVTTHFEVIG